VFALVRLELYATKGHAWPDTVAFSPGTTRQLRARSISLGGEPITLDSVRWESSNPGVATVDARGGITAVSPGRAEIAAVLGTTRFTSSVNVVTYPTPLRFTSVGVGVRHACALATDGQAYCWGGNEQSQLATDQPTDRCETVTNFGKGSFTRNTFRCSGMPVAVNGGLRFTTLAASSWNTCGLTEEGAVYCWGSNHKNPVPVAVGGSLRLRTLSAGSSMTCGLSAAGSAYCWSDDPASAPAEVPGGLTFRSVNAGGSHACGIASNGAAYCWGTNFYGQLGNGNTNASATPVPVTRGTQFSAIEAGSSITCALDAAGKAYCWGYQMARLGSQSVDSSTPVAAARDLTFASLLDGGTACGLTAEGTSFCWANDAAPPVRSGPSFPVRSIAAAIGVECVIALDGITHCAGVRWQGQTGAGFIDSQNTGYTRVARQ
jgi:alpha-tubulin suppressor-like RCC1 family protein